MSLPHRHRVDGSHRLRGLEPRAHESDSDVTGSDPERFPERLPGRRSRSDDLDARGGDVAQAMIAIEDEHRHVWRNLLVPILVGPLLGRMSGHRFRLI